MGRMILHPKQRAGKYRPRVERLDARLVLSAVDAAGPFLGVSAWSVSAAASTTSGLSVVSVSPADGAVVDASPSTVVVTFDRPVDPISLGFSDVRFERFVGGGWVDVFDADASPSQWLDDAGTSLIVTPSSPLVPGQYRLTIPVGSTLSAADGTPLAGAGAG